MYLQEIQDKLLAMLGVEVAVSTICKTLHAMGCSRQKISTLPHSNLLNAELSTVDR